MWTVPRIRERLFDVTKRGGRVIVVDPRRTETAEAFEHVAIRPDGDAWLLASMLQVIFEEGLADEGALADQTVGVEVVQAFVADFPPEATESRTGLPPDAGAGPGPGGRQSPGGRLPRPVRRLTRPPLDDRRLPARRAGTGDGQLRPARRARVRAADDLVGEDRPPVQARHLRRLPHPDRRTSPTCSARRPIAIAPKEITTPGKGQLRALLIAAGNPVTSAPDRAEWDDALPRLDLLVSMDFYVTETNRHADYILPATTFLERDDYPWFIGGHMTPPYAVWTDAVEAPRGEARPEWWVVAQIARRLKVEPSAVPAVRALGKLGIRLPPAKAIDLFLRTGSEGDFYGLRPKGLSLKKLRRSPGGRLLADRCETGVLRKSVFHKDKVVHFDHPEIRKAMDRLKADRRRRPRVPAAARQSAGAAVPQHLVPQRRQADAGTSPDGRASIPRTPRNSASRKATRWRSCRGRAGWRCPCASPTRWRRV